VVGLAAAAAFMIGPASAVFVVPGCLLARAGAAAVRCRRRDVIEAGSISVVVLGAWLAYWDLWNREFIYEDDGRPVPTALHVGYVIALLACSLGVLILCAAVIRSVARARKNARPGIRASGAGSNRSRLPYSAAERNPLRS
jgi:hypothetical protein